MRNSWTARRSNQSTLKEISPGCSLEGLMLKLKLQYFGHLMQRADSFEKILMLGKIEGRRRRGQQRMRRLEWHHQLNGHEFGWTPGVGDGQGGLVYCAFLFAVKLLRERVDSVGARPLSRGIWLKILASSSALSSPLGLLNCGPLHWGLSSSPCLSSSPLLVS